MTRPAPDTIATLGTSPLSAELQRSVSPLLLWQHNGALAAVEGAMAAYRDEIVRLNTLLVNSLVTSLEPEVTALVERERRSGETTGQAINRLIRQGVAVPEQV